MLDMLNPYKVRSTITRLRIYALARWRLIVGIFILFVDAFTFAFMPVDLGTFLALPAILVALIFLWFDLKEQERTQLFDVRDRTLPLFSASQVSTSLDCAIIGHAESVPKSDAIRNRQAVYWPALNIALQHTTIKSKISDKKWSQTLSEQQYIWAILEAQQRKIVYNGTLVKQETELEEAFSAKEPFINLKKTDYISALQTNHFADKSLYRDSRRTSDKLADGLSKFLIDPISGRIKTISETKHSNANNIGISTVVILKNSGSILLVLQGKESAKSENLLAPSGSGSLDWNKDISSFQDSLQSFQKILLRGMRRELNEETGIDGKNVIEERVVGYARLLHYAGKPEYFGLAIVNCSEDELKIRWSERPFVQRHEWLHVRGNNAAEYCENFREDIKNLASDPDYSIILRLNLKFVLDALIENDFGLAKKIFGE